MFLMFGDPLGDNRFDCINSTSLNVLTLDASCRSAFLTIFDSMIFFAA